MLQLLSLVRNIEVSPAYVVSLRPARAWEIALLTGPPYRQTTRTGICRKGRGHVLSTRPRGLSPSLVLATAFSRQQSRFSYRHPTWAVSMGAWELQVTKTHIHCFPKHLAVALTSIKINEGARKQRSIQWNSESWRIVTYLAAFRIHVRDGHTTTDISSAQIW